MQRILFIPRFWPGWWSMIVILTRYLLLRKFHQTPRTYTRYHKSNYEKDSRHKQVVKGPGMFQVFFFLDYYDYRTCSNLVLLLLLLLLRCLIQWMTVAMLPSWRLKAYILGHPSPSPIQLLCWIVAFPESDDSNEQSRAVLEGIPKLQGVQNEKWEAFPSFASKSSKLSKFFLFLLRKTIAKKNLPDWSQKKAFFLRFPKQGTLLAGSLALVAAYCFSTHLIGDLGSRGLGLIGHLDLF